MDTLEELAQKVESLVGQAEPTAATLAQHSDQLTQILSTLSSLERLARATAGKVLGVSNGS